MFKQLILAFGFLTIIPMPRVSYEADDLGRAGKWFPFVGAVIGTVLFFAESLYLQAFPHLLAGALTLATWVWLTGGLHMDGLVDCFDGMSAAASRERRLEIMRDPRMGAFGGIGLGLFLILKFMTVGLAYNRLFALLLAPIVGRFTLLLVARQHPARPGGLGDAFSKGIGIGSLIVAGIVPIAMIPVGYYYLDCPLEISGAALGAGLLTALFVSQLARFKLGGMTGDVLGLSVEMSELAVLLVFTSSFNAQS